MVLTDSAAASAQWCRPGLSLGDHGGCGTGANSVTPLPGAGAGPARQTSRRCGHWTSRRLGTYRCSFTSLVGREVEVAATAWTLLRGAPARDPDRGRRGRKDPACSVQVGAAALTDEFADGVWVFELATINDARRCP